MSELLDSQRVVPLIEKAEGVTASERYLHQLCEHSFLSLWTYPGVYRNQGKQTAKQEGKEVCDLVVVFGNHIILFSDKDCAFSDSGDSQLDWKRWHKKAVLKSADQLWGAERWFQDFQDRLYLDRACEHPFPIALPKPSEIAFHRIAVARGANARCKQHYSGGSGSLPFYARWALQATAKDESESPSFVLSDIDPSRGFVHIFDDVALETVLQTLDTIRDFLDYITRRDRFLRSRSLQSVSGEEDLLAFYMQSWRSDGELDFVVPNMGTVGPYSMPRSVLLGEGGWESLINSPMWAALQAWREVSYFWDSLIQYLSDHTISGTLYDADDPSPRHQETLLRFLAAEPRYRRRQLSAALLGQISRAATNDVLDRSARIMLPPNEHSPVYVVVVVGSEEDETHDQYRQRRRSVLNLYCLAAKHLHPIFEQIIAIGVEPRDVEPQRRTYDLIYLDTRVWTEQMAEHASRVHNEGGILKNVRVQRTGPEPRHYLDAIGQVELGTRIMEMKLGRNDVCPCGSGRKYKRCHGRT